MAFMEEQIHCGICDLDNQRGLSVKGSICIHSYEHSVTGKHSSDGHAMKCNVPQSAQHVLGSDRAMEGASCHS